MSKKKKPNYALRRKMAKIILVLIVLIPIIIINRVKILNLTFYIPNMKYSNIIDALFDINYNKDEAKILLNKLKKENKTNDKTADYILKLDSKGYNKNTINYVLENLSNKEITELLSEKYSKDFEKYITLDLFDYKKYDRYVKFQSKNKKLSLDDVVTRVELDLDTDFYENAVEEKNPNSITCLVNKHRYLSEDYEPDDLVNMDDDYANNRDNQKKLRKEAYEMFKKMVDAARKVDINFYAESAFRTYSYQEYIYNGNMSVYGREKTDTFAARPGFSEHQTGLTVDLANTWTIREDSDEYRWIKRNAYKYGYIIRYTEENKDITGFNAESWHIRYVGKKAAKIIKQEDLTLDEYFVKYVKYSKKK